VVKLARPTCPTISAGLEDTFVTRLLRPTVNSVNSKTRIPSWPLSTCREYKSEDVVRIGINGLTTGDPVCSYSHAWRNFGILIAYCIFNVFAALAIYYLARVPKKAKAKKGSEEKKGASNDTSVKKA
jgi:hypothetical protein